MSWALTRYSVNVPSVGGAAGTSFLKGPSLNCIRPESCTLCNTFTVRHPETSIASAPHWLRRTPVTVPSRYLGGVAHAERQTDSLGGHSARHDHVRFDRGGGRDRLVPPAWRCHRKRRRGRRFNQWTYARARSEWQSERSIEFSNRSQ